MATSPRTKLFRRRNLYHFAVSNYCEPLTHMCNDSQIMAHHHNRQLVPHADIDQQIQYLCLNRRIKSGSWLIQKQYARFSDQRACDGNPLTLASGQLVRKAKAKLISEPDFFEGPGYSAAHIIETVNHERLRYEAIDSMVRVQ